jgi:hypothetical protein
VLSGLAQHYRSAVLGPLDIVRSGGRTLVDVGEWHSAVATRRNDDGSISLITIDPAYVGFEFVIGQKGGKRALITRDGQHEYFFIETSSS